VTGFLRIVIQPNFPNRPTPLPQALAVIETLDHLPKVIAEKAGTVKSFPQSGTNPKPNPFPFR
jgi:hypothetical protein